MNSVDVPRVLSIDEYTGGKNGNGKSRGVGKKPEETFCSDCGREISFSEDVYFNRYLKKEWCKECKTKLFGDEGDK